MKIDNKYVETFWEHLCDTIPTENLEYATDEFDINVNMLRHLNTLSDEEVCSLMCNLVYMAVNEIYSGDFDTVYEILVDNCNIPEETVNELLDF